MKLLHYVKPDGQYVGAASIPDGADLEDCYNPHRDAGFSEVPNGAESSAWFWNFELGAWYLPPSADDERAWRDAELAAVTWLRDRHRDEVDIGVPTTLSAERFTELLLYMQQLREWPQSELFPESDSRPVPPDWIEAESS